MAFSLNGVAIPESIYTKGVYKFHKQRVGGTNGNGVAQAAGPQIVEWVFGTMTAAELAYFYTTICAGALSVTLTAAVLKDDLLVEQTFTSGQAYRPVWTSYAAGLYREVSVTISHLLPLI